jgi:hypothetical protein
MTKRVIANNCIETVEKQNVIHKKSELLISNSLVNVVQKT